jgi:hypothetical protein
MPAFREMVSLYSFCPNYLFFYNRFVSKRFTAPGMFVMPGAFFRSNFINI